MGNRFGGNLTVPRKWAATGLGLPALDSVVEGGSTYCNRAVTITAPQGRDSRKKKD